ncbi:MAG TPA: site-specific integrase [Bryobacteraceae bacterium]|jgi:integrase|nr:site-specific integrase [Bryobacteraceae bacterium]
MARKRIVEGPIGNGWIDEVRTDNGVRFVARWKKFVADPEAPEGRRRINGGQYEIGPKVYHGPGLKSKKDAEKAWLQICDTVMGRVVDIPAGLKAKKTLRWFTEEDPEGFRKHREKRWSGSMPKWYDYLMNNFILRRFGDTALSEMREQDMQAFLNELANNEYSESVVKNTKTYLNAILDEAKEQGALQVNPARNLIKPRNTRKPQRSFITAEQYQKVIVAAPTFRDRLMMAILYIVGLRRGELFGLQWRDWNGTNTLMIERQILEDLSVGPAKSDGSIAPVVIPTDVARDLNEWRKWCPDSSSEGWIFASPRKAHINPGFWRKTVLIPAGSAAGIVKLSFHAFRRGFATEAHSQGATDKSIQAQLRHRQASTTRDLYMQPIAEDQRQSVETFSKRVNTRPN